MRASGPSTSLASFYLDCGLDGVELELGGHPNRLSRSRRITVDNLAAFNGHLLEPNPSGSSRGEHLHGR